ncbi:putative membrane protein [Bacilli bacterium PM5-3]|nr:putative membrane protein [Bacilli bacterium PM5-3]MDH6603857.1 putative membrane protein [Bacilli bacterium PM5-9]
MNRDLFLRDLRNELRPLSLSEQEQIIDEYLSIFEIKRDEGLSDEEIIRELGNPRKIASQFLKEFNMENEYQYSSSSYSNNNYNSNRRIGLFIAMILFDVFIGIWLAFSAIMTLCAFLFSGFVMIVTSIALPFVVGTFSPLAAFASFFIVVGLGLIFIAMSMSLFRLLFIGLSKHINWLKSLL